MASVLVEAVEAYEAPRQSLLEVVQEKLAAKGQSAHGPGGIPARVVLACHNGERVTSKDMVAGFWEELLGYVREELGGGPETGIVLVYPDATLVVIEASTRQVMDVLRKLDEVLVEAAPEERMFARVRVCASTEDIPRAAYPGFEAAFVNSATAEQYEAEEADNLIKSTSEVNIAMLKLGAKLGGMGRGETEQVLRNLTGAFPDLPVMQSLMGLLLAEDGAPTLAEFLDIYDAALDIDLDSENVWPLPPPLKFL
mmetsp:Transcript_12213/g.29523  ORF Transcript_12213/g.29523 Transcript_12213/m.29523 type:complete len:254 (+) Transcript_12213:211-972(+)|eukprot:CAMPEP_0197591338 /NCGR_PEP_ID=MMETSP1326-20131121/13016_1 /TAXON_ID=1155430 /ORGANISM="Genus nov. species nov., Strain RCC2288" /LENGTH=253 /DNA_ID=CAMNT_0043156741 /DNA_START=205 /DNA_END=966 /DNA_ORIENTATION=+